MTDILIDQSPSSLSTAVKGNLYAFFHRMRYSAKVAFHDGTYGFRWLTKVPHPWFNGILSTVSPPADPDQVVQETVDYFQSHNVAIFSWWLAPHLETTSWSHHLLARGFQYDNDTPGMVIDLSALPRREKLPLTIRQVEDPEMLAEWSQILVQGFEMPEEMASSFVALLQSMDTDLPLRHYLGYLNGRPVACSTLFLGAEVAGIYNVATVVEARGRGIGSAMTLIPLYEARDMGYRVGVLQSSAMGYYLYQRMGFQTVCQMDYFYWQGLGS